MDHRISALCLALLALSSATKALASPDESDVAIGTVQLVVSPLGISALPIDPQPVAESGCRPEDQPLPPYSGNLGQCHLKVAVPVGSLLFEARVPGGPPGTSLREILRSMKLQATGVDLTGEPVATSCGLWDVSLRFDATEPQPASPLVLAPGSEGSGKDSFASVLEINVQLHLVNQATGQIIDDPLVLALGMKGLWNPAADGSKNPFETKDISFEDKDEDKDYCIPAWLAKENPELTQLLIDEGCAFCMDSIIAEPERSGSGNPFH